MKAYRDKKTGEVFDSLRTAQAFFCATNGRDCCRCSFREHIGNGPCLTWCKENPEEAARLMGFEPLGEPKNCLNCGHYKQAYVCEMSERTVKNPRREDPPCVLWGKENTMEKQDNPRLAEVLGVEVGEHIRIGDYPGEYWITEDGWYAYAGNDVAFDAIIYAINHPENVIREPRLTEPEIAIMKATGTKWASRNTGEEYVDLWADGPYLATTLATTDKRFYSRNGVIARVHSTRMPSVGPGGCLRLEEQ